ncbi:hypothetical protein SUGI_0330810 [Cryptomeria japonica]|nr:hypothetical protein SUGI_0330810 [Cryptomeria japonica]
MRDAIATLEAYDQRKATKKRTTEAMAAPRADLSSMGSHTDVGASSSSLGPRIRGMGSVGSHMENYFVPQWVAALDDVDNDFDPFLTDEQLSELERAGEEWDAEVAAHEEEEHVVDHATEAPTEDVATTLAPPPQWQ